jgi:hypothetical protein
MPIHERFDLAAWIREFPLERLRAEAEAFVHERRRRFPERYADDAAVAEHISIMHPHGDIVVGPKNVAVNEQLRAEATASAAYSGSRVATDVVVWCEGEPAQRAVTKIGGRPYRPASARWPTDADGPLRFIAQLCFADSRDLLPALPGDILLIFGDDDALLAEPERLVFEWVELGVADLVEHVPERDDRLGALHGALHRTKDWTDADEDTFDGDEGSHYLAVWEGTKLGGAPRYVQGDENPGGTFIGALGSIAVPDDQRYPFVNRAEPRGGSGENDLMIGDMGSLYLFLLPDGRMCGVPQCY